MFFLTGNCTGPKFVETIPNVNVTAGRDVSLPCVVDDIGQYQVSSSIVLI